MLQQAIRAGIELRRHAPVKELILAEGRVVGVVTEKDGRPWRVGARLGVLLNAGGFAHNQEMRDRYIPHARVERTHAAPGDTIGTTKSSRRLRSSPSSASFAQGSAGGDGAGGTAMHKTVEEMLAEAAIKDIHIRYCRACDRMDFALMRECFHADATADYGFFGGSLDEFIEGARAGLPLYVATTHNTGNQIVEVSGDVAWAEHYTVATHRLAADEVGPERDFVTAVRYIDRVECRGGDWRIAKRVLILDWMRSDPVTVIEPRPEVQGGKRDRSDASYAR